MRKRGDKMRKINQTIQRKTFTVSFFFFFLLKSDIKEQQRYLIHVSSGLYLCSDLLIKKKKSQMKWCKSTVINISEN